MAVDPVALIKAYADTQRDAQVRKNAVVALGVVGTDASAAQLAAIAVQERDAELRDLAREQLLSLPDAVFRTAVGGLCKRLDDEDTRAAAYTLLGHLRGKGASAAVRALPAMRRVALASWAALPTGRELAWRCLLSLQRGLLWGAVGVLLVMAFFSLLADGLGLNMVQPAWDWVATAVGLSGLLALSSSLRVRAFTLQPDPLVGFLVDLGWVAILTALPSAALALLCQHYVGLSGAAVVAAAAGAAALGVSVRAGVILAGARRAGLVGKTAATLGGVLAGVVVLTGGAILASTKLALADGLVSGGWLLLSPATLGLAISFVQIDAAPRVERPEAAGSGWPTAVTLSILAGAVLSPAFVSEKEDRATGELPPQALESGVVRWRFTVTPFTASRTFRLDERSSLSAWVAEGQPSVGELSLSNASGRIVTRVGAVSSLRMTLDPGEYTLRFGRSRSLRPASALRVLATRYRDLLFDENEGRARIALVAVADSRPHVAEAQALVTLPKPEPLTLDVKAAGVVHHVSVEIELPRPIEISALPDLALVGPGGERATLKPRLRDDSDRRPQERFFTFDEVSSRELTLLHGKPASGNWRLELSSALQLAEQEAGGDQLLLKWRLRLRAAPPDAFSAAPDLPSQWPADGPAIVERRIELPGQLGLHDATLVVEALHPEPGRLRISLKPEGERGQWAAVPVQERLVTRGSVTWWTWRLMEIPALRGLAEPLPRRWTIRVQDERLEPDAQIARIELRRSPPPAAMVTLPSNPRHRVDLAVRMPEGPEVDDVVLYLDGFPVDTVDELVLTSPSSWPVELRGDEPRWAMANILARSGTDPDASASGRWLIGVSDRQGGTVDLAWTARYPVEVLAKKDLSLDIPDWGDEKPGVVTADVEVPNGDAPICQWNIIARVTHTLPDDLMFFVVPPDGERVELSKPRRSTDGSRFTWKLTDQPEICPRRNESVAGVWRFVVEDHEREDVGTLDEVAFVEYREFSADRAPTAIGSEFRTADTEIQTFEVPDGVRLDDLLVSVSGDLDLYRQRPWVVPPFPVPLRLPLQSSGSIPVRDLPGISRVLARSAAGRWTLTLRDFNRDGGEPLQFSWGLDDRSPHPMRADAVRARKSPTGIHADAWEFTVPQGYQARDLVLWLHRPTASEDELPPDEYQLTAPIDGAAPIRVRTRKNVGAQRWNIRDLLADPAVDAMDAGGLWSLRPGRGGEGQPDHRWAIHARRPVRVLASWRSERRGDDRRTISGDLVPTMPDDPIERALDVRIAGSARALVLRAGIVHEIPSELAFTVTSPAGVSHRLPVLGEKDLYGISTTDGSMSVSFPLVEALPPEALDSDTVVGRWTVSVVDTVDEDDGRLQWLSMEELLDHVPKADPISVSATTSVR